MNFINDNVNSQNSALASSSISSSSPNRKYDTNHYQGCNNNNVNAQNWYCDYGNNNVNC